MRRSFWQYPHSIIKKTFWPWDSLNVWTFPKRVHERQITKVFLRCVGIVEFEREGIVISFGGVWLEFWDKDPFLKCSSFSWLINSGGTFSRFIFYHSRLVINYPSSPGGSFYVAACNIQNLVLMNVLCSLAISKKITYLLVGRGWCGLLQYCFMSQMYSKNEKVKNEIFLHNQRGTSGRDEVMQCITFFSFSQHIFWSHN